LPPRLTASQGAFQIDGKPAFLLSGEMHYFRVRREQWDESLRRIKALGISVVSTYIPWVWHEPDEGHFDFTGTTHPNRDLVGFLAACRDAGLGLLARPGPLVYAEFEGLGVPLWLGSRYPETVVVRRDGSQDRGDFYYNHSLLHPGYRARVKRWYEAVVPTLRPFFDDPVLSFQIDNETGLLFANRIGEVDFNLDTVARYRAYLETTYGGVAELNARWGTKHGGFDRLQPPKPPLRQPEIHDWQQFLELWICRYLIWLRGIALDLGVTVPLTHNEQGLHHSPAHVCDRTGLVDFLGYDLYPKASPRRNTLDFPFATSFYPALFANYTDENRPLWGSEIGTGWMDSRTQVSEEAVVQNAFGSLANGARGINFFPIHDGREPIGGSEYRFRTALDADGRYTPRARTIEAVGRFLEAHGERLVSCQVVRDPLAFGIYYPNFHFAADEYVWGTVLPDPHRYLAFLGQAGLHALLLCCGFSPRVVDLGEVGDLVSLDGLRCLLWSSKGYLDNRTYGHLVDWVGAGGHLVTAPVPPMADLHGQPCARTELFPIAPSRVRSVDRALSLATMAYGLLRFWLFHRSQLREEHLSSGHVIELYEPLLHLLSTPARGVPFAHPWGEPIPGDYRSATFDLSTAPTGVKVEPGPLSRPKPDPKLAASYRVHHGAGTATLLGTQPAGRYVTPRYYETSAATRQALRRFLLGMLSEFGVEPNVETELELEIVPHRAPDGGGYLFLINRLDRQTGRIRFRRPLEWGYRGHARVAFSFLGSGAVAHDDQSLDVDLAAQDVLVVSLPPA
jgi:glycosyl hydrolase family 42 (putative beta-galactosidase)